uniref:Uncharacterized protein n=1 Tax=Rhipicephalus pulchellus TaxID=72859 RepID=L7LXX9_RHIPC
MMKFCDSRTVAVLVVAGIILTTIGNRSLLVTFAAPLPGCCIGKLHRGSKAANSSVRLYQPHFHQRTSYNHQQRQKDKRHHHHHHHHHQENQHSQSPQHGFLTKRTSHDAPPKPPRLYLPPYNK